MRIISMHILTTDPGAAKPRKAHFLSSAYELGFINFLQRYFFKEHLVFGARTCISNLQPGDNVCIKLEETDQALAYAVLLPSGLGGVIIADKEYPGKVAIKIIHEFLGIFQKSISSTEYSNLEKDKDVGFSQLDSMIKKYQDPKEADKLLKLENELGQVQQMLTKTMSDLVDRQQKLDDLMEKSGDISKVSMDFYKKAKATNTKCCNLY